MAPAPMPLTAIEVSARRVLTLKCAVRAAAALALTRQDAATTAATNWMARIRRI